MGYERDQSATGLRHRGKGSKEYEDIQNQIQDKLLAAGKEGIKIQIDSLEADNAAQITIIEKHHLLSGNSEAQYQADLLAQSLSFLHKKTTIYKIGSKDFYGLTKRSLKYFYAI